MSDFCLVDKRISVEPAPSKVAGDPMNKYDTDTTVLEALTHNAVHDRLCPAR